MSRILIVDDDPLILEMLDLALSLGGHEVLRAATGAEGVDTARREMPDLVVLDWMMPVMNGIVAARTLRDDPRTTAVPVLMLTARGTDADLLRGYQSGVAAYIVKPLDPGVLLAEVARLTPPPPPVPGPEVDQPGPRTPVTNGGAP